MQFFSPSSYKLHIIFKRVFCFVFSIKTIQTKEFLCVDLSFILPQLKMVKIKQKTKLFLNGESDTYDFMYFLT